MTRVPSGRPPADQAVGERGAGVPCGPSGVAGPGERDGSGAGRLGRAGRLLLQRAPQFLDPVLGAVPHPGQPRPGAARRSRLAGRTQRPATSSSSHTAHQSASRGTISWPASAATRFSSSCPASRSEASARKDRAPRLSQSRSCSARARGRGRAGSSGASGSAAPLVRALPGVRQDPFEGLLPSGRQPRPDGLGARAVGDAPGLGEGDDEVQSAPVLRCSVRRFGLAVAVSASSGRGAPQRGAREGWWSRTSTTSVPVCSSSRQLSSTSVPACTTALVTSSLTTTTASSASRSVRNSVPGRASSAHSASAAAP